MMRPNFRRLKEMYYGIDGILLLLGIIVLIFALYFFFQDDSISGAEHLEMMPVGHFAQSHNDVRRRVQSGFAWANITRQEVVFEGDSIFTGEDSGATIDLEAGGKLTLDAKSLVVVKTQGKKLQLDLQYGSLVGKVSTGAPIMISQNGQLEELSGQDAEFRIESTEGSKETSIRVVRGEVKLKKIGKPLIPKLHVAANVPEGKKVASRDLGKLETSIPDPVEQIIHQSEAINLQAEEPDLLQKVEAETTSPADGKVYWLHSDSAVELDWKLINLPSKPPRAVNTSQLELARDKEFTNVFLKTTTTAQKYVLAQEQRPKGSFYWRVQVLDKNKKPEGLASAAASLALYADVQPNPVFPTDFQEFAFDPTIGERGKQVLLTWEDPAGSTDYDLQLARDPAFAKPALDKNTKALTEQTVVLAAGTYYWHVRGHNSQRAHSDWSRTVQFKIDKVAVQPTVPQLTDLNLKYEIPQRVLDRAPRNVSVTGHGVQPEGLTPFTWNKVDDTESYEIELAPTESFANSIKHSTATETTFAPGEVRPGPLYARVRAHGRKGLVSPPSSAARLEVTLPAPQLEAIPAQTDKFASQDLLDQGKYDFKLNWPPLAFAETYELDWATDPDFAKSKKFRLKDSSRAITVSQPGDYSARVRALGPDGVPLSPYSTVQVATYKKDLLPPPPVVVPKPVPAALPSPPSPPGVHQASIKDSSRKPANKGEFALPTPNLTEPLRASSFVSLNDSVPYVNLKWRTVKGAESYEIQLAQDADFTQIVSTVKSLRNLYLIQQALPEGRIFWRVRAIAKVGVSDWSNVYDLNVLYQ